MNLPLDEYEVLLRNDLATFIDRCFAELHPGMPYFDNWHIHVIAAYLEAARRGEIRRLIINVPPRSLKSLIASVAFPAFILGHSPSDSILSVTYGQDLSNQFALDCRTIMLSDWYQALFPTRLVGSRPSASELRTTAQGIRIATSVGGVLTGRGGEYIIIDDPTKPEEALSKSQRDAVIQWYGNTLLSRLNNKKTGCIIVVMQRLHEDDLTGHLLQEQGWEILRLPAIAEEEECFEIQTLFGKKRYVRKPGELLHPEREPEEVLNELRRGLGEFAFAGQYQQRPVPQDGGLIKEAWLQYYEEHEKPEKFDQVIQSWDTANKDTELSDYSVCTTWGILKKKIYLLHVHRARMDFPALKRAVIEQAGRYQPQVILIEDKASGTSLIQELRQGGLTSVKAYKPEGNKVMRMHAQTAQIEGGFVLLPKQTPWLPGYLQEMLTFPRGAHDDQVDSTSQALGWIQQYGSEPGIIAYYREEVERMRRGE